MTTRLHSRAEEGYKGTVWVHPNTPPGSACFGHLYPDFRGDKSHHLYDEPIRHDAEQCKGFKLRPTEEVTVDLGLDMREEEEEDVVESAVLHLRPGKSVQPLMSS